MNIREVFEKCNNGDYVIDNFNKKWKVEEEELKQKYFDNWCIINNFYTLKQIMELDFKKDYNVDWSKVEVDTKILVSNDDVRWYRAHFAKFENNTIYSFSNGTTSFTYEYSAFEPWKYAILYEEGNNFVSLRELL